MNKARLFLVVVILGIIFGCLLIAVHKWHPLELMGVKGPLYPVYDVARSAEFSVQSKIPLNKPNEGPEKNSSSHKPEIKTVTITRSGCGWPKKGTVTSFNLSLLRQPKSPSSNKLIDLDKAVPSIDELYDRLTLVTAWSQNHFKEGVGFIATAQKYMAEKRIIVYDLGLNNDSVQQVKSMCNVELRRFPFENYPEHYKNLKKFAFKPTIINMVLDEFGVIYYGDASIRFMAPVKELFPDALAHRGFLPHIRCFNPKIPPGKPMGCKHDYTLTVKQVYPILGVNEREYYNAGFTAPAISGGIMMIINNTFLHTKIMRPWLECALNEACIAPEGADLGNHRFDQSALTLLFFKHMRGEWIPKNSPSPHHCRVVHICRDKNGFDWEPQSCTNR